MARAAGRGRSVAVGLLAVVTTLTTFADWGRSGERARTSYELVGVVERADVLGATAARAAPLWYLVPAICGMTLVALATRRHVLAGLVAATLGALVATGALLVDRSPLVAEPAVGMAVVVGGATVLGGFVVVATAQKEMAE